MNNMWRLLCLMALCLSSGSGIAIAKSQPESSADADSDAESDSDGQYISDRRIADLLYHAAVSADNDIHGDYRAVVSVPEPAIAVVDNPVIATQYHAQDEFGQYSYGYSNPTSTKAETRTLDGVVEGTYSYVSPDGRIITNNYAADHTGFRSSLAPSNGEELIAVAPAIAVDGPLPPVDIATAVVSAVDAYAAEPGVRVSASVPVVDDLGYGYQTYRPGRRIQLVSEPEQTLVSHAAVPVTHSVEHRVEPIGHTGLAQVEHHVQHHAPAVVSHHANPVYVEEQPAVIARTAPVAAVAYTPESVAAVAHRAETAYIQEQVIHTAEPAYVQETVHHAEPAYVQQRTYVEPVAVAQPAVAVAKPVYQVAQPVATVQPAVRHHHHTVAPVVHHAKPVVHHAQPIVHHAKPVVAPAVTVARNYPYQANIKPATVRHSAPVVAKRVYHQEPKPVVVSSLGSRSFVRPTTRSHARTYTQSYSKPYRGYSTGYSGSYRRPSYTYSRGGYRGRTGYNSGYRSSYRRSGY